MLWVTFTRSNPAVDIDGIGAETLHKHWGCRGSLVIDARIKPHHAPPLIEDPEVTRGSTRSRREADPCTACSELVRREAGSYQR